MNNTTITINGKDFVLQFGMKFFRLLSEKWNVPGLQSVIVKLAVLEQIADDPTFEQISVLNDLILAAVQVNPDNKEPVTFDELDDLFLTDTAGVTQILEKVMTGLVASLPKPNEPGKKQAVKKAIAK